MCLRCPPEIFQASQSHLETASAAMLMISGRPGAIRSGLKSGRRILDLKITASSWYVRTLMTIVGMLSRMELIRRARMASLSMPIVVNRMKCALIIRINVIQPILWNRIHMLLREDSRLNLLKRNLILMHLTGLILVMIKNGRIWELIQTMEQCAHTSSRILREITIIFIK